MRFMDNQKKEDISSSCISLSDADHQERQVFMLKKFGKAGIAAAVLLCLDQYTKYLAVLYLKGKPAIEIITGILELRYLENAGAAFGSMQGMQKVLLCVTILALAAILYVYRKIPDKRRYFPLRMIAVLLFSGAVGNMIDRLMQRYVVDFIYVKWIDFPIFNVADCYVTIAAVLLIIFVLFVYQEEEFSFIREEKKE
jgi:signal peptidase II